MSNQKGSGLIIFIIAAAVAFGAYKLILNKPVNVPEGAYVDSKDRYYLFPPLDWEEVNSETMADQADDMLPDHVKQMLSGSSRVEAMFMYMGQDQLLGSNLNIITIKQAGGIEFDDDNFREFETQVKGQLASMNLEYHRMLESELIDVNGKTYAYFENVFGMMGLSFYNIQVVIPADYGMSILTYTIMGGTVDSQTRTDIEDSYYSFTEL